MRAAVATIVAGFIACGAASPRAASSQSLYSESVAAYRREGAVALGAFLTIPQADVDAALELATATRGGWDWRRLRVAAMLHTEAFVHYLGEGRVSTGLPHLSAARRLLDATLERAPRTSEFVIRWYAVVERLTVAAKEPSVGQMLRRAQIDRWATLPARRLYRRGIQEEIRANQQGIATRFDARGQPVDFRSGQNSLFDAAAAALRKALAIDGSLDAASLRLGRVLMIQGHLDEAATALRRAMASEDAYTAYLALLFLGSIDERQGRFDQAASLYDRAMAVYPFGQSACLAQSHLRSRRGHAAEARGILIRCLGPARGKIVEPLWTYVALPEELLPARFDELRAEAWQ